MPFSSLVISKSYLLRINTTSGENQRKIIYDPGPSTHIQKHKYKYELVNMFSYILFNPWKDFSSDHRNLNIAKSKHVADLNQLNLLSVSEQQERTVLGNAHSRAILPPFCWQLRQAQAEVLSLWSKCNVRVEQKSVLCFHSQLICPPPSHRQLKMELLPVEKKKKKCYQHQTQPGLSTESSPG